MSLNCTVQVFRTLWWQSCRLLPLTIDANPLGTTRGPFHSESNYDLWECFWRLSGRTKRWKCAVFFDTLASRPKYVAFYFFSQSPWGCPFRRSRDVYLQRFAILALDDAGALPEQNGKNEKAKADRPCWAVKPERNAKIRWVRRNNRCVSSSPFLPRRCSRLLLSLI